MKRHAASLLSCAVVGLLVSTPLLHNYLESAVSLYLLGLSAIIQLNLIMTWVNVVACLTTLLRKQNEPEDVITMPVGPKGEPKPLRSVASRIHHLVIISAHGEDESRVVSTLESLRHQRVLDVRACIHVAVVLGPGQEVGERRHWLCTEFGPVFADFEVLGAPPLEPDEVCPRAASERAALRWFEARRLAHVGWRPSGGSSEEEEDEEEGAGAEWASDADPEEGPSVGSPGAVPGPGPAALRAPELLVSGADGADPPTPGDTSFSDPAAAFVPLSPAAAAPVRFVDASASRRRRRRRRPAELRVPLPVPSAGDSGIPRLGPSAASTPELLSLEGIEPELPGLARGGGGDGGAGALSASLPRRASAASSDGGDALGVPLGDRDASREHLVPSSGLHKADVLVTCCGSFAVFQDDYFWTATTRVMRAAEGDRPLRLWQAAVLFDYWEGWVFERVISTIRCWLQIGMFGPMQIQPSPVFSALWPLFERTGFQDARFSCPDAHAFLAGFVGSAAPVRIETMPTCVVTRFAPSSFSPAFTEAAGSLFGHFRQLGCRTQQELAFLLAARPRMRFFHWIGLCISSLLLDPIIAQLGFIFVFWSFLPTYLRPELTAVVYGMSFDRAFIVVNAAAIVTIGSLFLFTLYFEYRHRGPWKRRRRTLVKSFVMLLENVLSPFVLLAFMSVPFLVSMTQMALGIRIAPPKIPTPAVPPAASETLAGPAAWFRPKSRGRPSSSHARSANRHGAPSNPSSPTPRRASGSAASPLPSPQHLDPYGDAESSAPASAAASPAPGRVSLSRGRAHSVESGT
eukprot:tig00020675_g12641.t1